MENRKVQRAASDTALYTALRRAIANKLYPNEPFGADNLAEVFLPPHFRFFLRFHRVLRNARSKLESFMPGMTEYVIARTRFFDELFLSGLRGQISQIVLLGAGYDSRAYRFAQMIRGTRIYELDAPLTQQRKIERLRAAHVGIPDAVKYVAVDFNSEALESALGRAGYKCEERTLFLWEGVIYYLEEASAARTLEFVGRHAERNSMIAFDYAVTVTGENAADLYGARQFNRAMEEYHAREGLVFTIAEGDIEAFLAGRGLVLARHMDCATIEQTYLTDAAGKLFGRMSGNFRLASAQPMR